MGLLIFTLIVAVASTATFTVLVRGKRTERRDWLGWIGASLGAVSVTILSITMIAEHGISADALTFLMTFSGLLIVTGATVYFVRKRKPPFEDRTQRNFVPNARTHAWGTYSAETVAARKRRVF